MKRVIYTWRGCRMKKSKIKTVRGSDPVLECCSFDHQTLYCQLFKASCKVTPLLVRPARKSLLTRAATLIVI
jgi:hypothetical protein